MAAYAYLVLTFLRRGMVRMERWFPPGAPDAATLRGNEEKNNRRTLPQQWLFDERQIRRWNPHRKALEAGKDIPREFRARRRNICQAVAACTYLLGYGNVQRDSHS
uniref:Uncharacterized protein n=1 Tax=Vespula pensylvanica TaxID=30213 RepID=A0A834UE10_VESPE|nr:hypothetical protein H0235_002161 [Vespula pensylvanica]